MKNILLILILISNLHLASSNLIQSTIGISDSILVATSSDEEYDDDEGSEEEQENEEIEENA